MTTQTSEAATTESRMSTTGPPYSPAPDECLVTPAGSPGVRGVRRFIRMLTTRPTARVQLSGRMLVHDLAAWDRVLSELTMTRDPE